MNISLSQIVSLYLSEGDKSAHAFQRCYTLAQRGKTDLDLDVTGKLLTVLLQVNPNKTATLPTDFIDYVRCGLLNNEGEIESFGYNKDLTSFKDQDSDRTTSPIAVTAQDQLLPGFPAYQTLANPNFIDLVTMPLGVGSAPQSRAHFKIDKSAHLVLLGPNTTSQSVLLEYLSSGIGEEGECIDIMAQEALIAFIAYRDMLGRKGNANAIVMARKEYYNQKRNVKARMSGMQLHRINEAVRSTTMGAPNY